MPAPLPFVLSGWRVRLVLFAFGYSRSVVGVSSYDPCLPLGAAEMMAFLLYVVVYQVDAICDRALMNAGKGG